MRGLHSHFLSVHVLYPISVTLSRWIFPRCRDALSPVMAGLVPATSIAWSTALFIIGITGTRPVMTRWGMTPSWVTVLGHTPSVLGSPLSHPPPSWPGLTRPSRFCETLRPQPTAITGAIPAMTRRVSFRPERSGGKEIHLRARNNGFTFSALRAARGRHGSSPRPCIGDEEKNAALSFQRQKRIDALPVESLPISKTFAESYPIGSYTGHCYAILRSESEHMSNEVKTCKRSKKADASNPMNT